MQITIREPGSAFTHFLGMLLAVFAAIPLLVKAGSSTNSVSFSAMSIFIISMILLYGASATYHAVNLAGRALRFFRKMDHMMIYVLIAGTYTPICLILLDEGLGLKLLMLIWSIAIAGMLLNLFWITCPKWLSSILYIAMGWVCVFVFRPLLQTLPFMGFFWLLLGGVIYTIGGVLYALKLKVFNAKHAAFGSHELFHLFVMGGSICHFIFMYLYVA